MTSTILDVTGLGRVMSAAQIRSLAHYQRRKISLWQGAVSAGKTISSLWALLHAISIAPRNGLIVIVAKTIQAAYDNLFFPLLTRELFGELCDHVSYTRGAPTAMILGREVIVMGSADVKAEGKIRGKTIALAYVDEATLLPVGFWEMLVTRLRVAGARLLATTNPGPRTHWLNEDWIQKAGTAGVDMQTFAFTMDDNPSLSEEYRASMKASFSGVFYERFILGRWTNAEGAIFDMWDPARHVVPWQELPPMLRLPGGGLDYGTSVASAGGMLGWGADNRLYIVSEFRLDPVEGVQRFTDAEISRRALQWYSGPHLPPDPNGRMQPPPEWLFLDPAAASLKAQMHYDGFRRAANATNAVVPSIKLIASLLSTDRLRIASTCPALIREIPGYRWDPKATERGEDAPIKEHDHSIDGALRYPIASTESVWARSVLAQPMAA